MAAVLRRWPGALARSADRPGGSPQPAARSRGLRLARRAAGRASSSRRGSPIDRTVGRAVACAPWRGWPDGRGAAARARSRDGGGGMGRARPRRGREQYRDAPAIRAQAAARSHGRRARRGDALALGRWPRCAVGARGAGAGGRERDGAGALHRQVAGSAARRASAGGRPRDRMRDALPRRRRRSRSRSAARSRRRGGPPPWSPPIVRWRAASRRISRAGGSPPTIRRAGRLSATPPGTLLTAIAGAAASGLRAGRTLLTLAQASAGAGAARQAAGEWLAEVRALDLALRGPRPAPGWPGYRYCGAAKARWVGGCRCDARAAR